MFDPGNSHPILCDELIPPIGYQAKLHTEHIARHRRFTQAAQKCQAAEAQRLARQELTKAAIEAARRFQAAQTKTARANAKAAKALANMPTARARAIVTQTAHDYGVSVDEIFGPRRANDITAARFAAMAKVARACPKWSLTQLGQFFHRDHTTILYALNEAREKQQ